MAVKLYKLESCNSLLAKLTSFVVYCPFTASSAKVLSMHTGAFIQSNLQATWGLASCPRIV